MPDDDAPWRSVARLHEIIAVVAGWLGTLGWVPANLLLFEVEQVPRIG